MRLFPRQLAAFATSGLLLCQPLFAFQIPLSETAVRDAYFLGQRNDQKTSDLLKLYTAALALPDKGPYISEIRLLTPYAQVVSVSSQNSVGYSAQQAEADYHGRGDTILVQFRVELTPTFTYLDAKRVAEDLAGELNRHLDPEDFWRAFSINVSQATDGDAHDRKTPEPCAVTAEPIYAHSGGSLGTEYIGSIVSLEFDANDFSSLPTRVEIITPAGLHTLATFDLENLR